LVKLAARTWVRSHGWLTEALRKRICHGIYDGARLGEFRRQHGRVPVLLAIPPMSDVNGALPHPGVRILQTVLRDQQIPCEVINYNLPTANPRDPNDHLIRAIRELEVRILGVSTYSQAIRHTMESLQRIKRACPEVTIVLGGPHPTESYRSLLGVRFIDYVCRGESEESFPRLVQALLDGRTAEARSIPGVYSLDREATTVRGVPAPFIDLPKFDERNLLRYGFRPEELKQHRLFRGSHGTAGANYWPVALVRGCPYDCTFCAAYQMSGKKLRYRAVGKVVDDLQYYHDAYGCRHFSFIDDAFTQHYDYVIDLCQEIVDRGLKVYWTTDNGIRYETLGGGTLLAQVLARKGIASCDELIRLMIRAGWRGTAIGIESGSARVRKDLVRKGGSQLTNESILDNLRALKRVAAEERVYLYVNGFLMAGFPELPLPQGKRVDAETEIELEQTRRFAMELRDRRAIDMMNLSIVIPLPATDLWDCLTIAEKARVLTKCVPAHHPDRAAVTGAVDRVVGKYGNDLEATRYQEQPEAEFWREIWALSDETQILVMQSYDDFNADSAHNIELKRHDRDKLWRYREEVVEEFYRPLGMKLKMLRHVLHRSHGLQDVLAYLTLLCRKYEPRTKRRLPA